MEVPMGGESAEAGLCPRQGGETTEKEPLGEGHDAHGRGTAGDA